MSICVDEQCTNELAAYICEREDLIVDTWIAAVRKDQRIPAADTITRQQLRDHLPQMFDDLADALRGAAEPDFAPAANAEQHGHHRWQEGYQLSELLRELARIRTVLGDYVFRFEDEHPEFTAEAKRTTARRLHFFFDNMVARSTEQFVNEQQAELRTRNTHLRAVDDARLRLLRTITHDLRNSVNASSLATDELAYAKEAAGREETVEVLRHGFEHMKELLGNLLTYATIFDAANSPRLVSIRVDGFVQELGGHFRPLAEAKGLIFSCQHDPAMELVISDATKLRQIAYNLVSNSVKYTERGHVTVMIRALDERNWTFIVEDSGPGIAVEERQHLYEEYFRSDRTAHLEGTGLGLSIVKRLVELLRGQIHLTSVPGEGARFDVVLPRGPRPD